MKTNILQKCSRRLYTIHRTKQSQSMLTETSAQLKQLSKIKAPPSESQAATIVSAQKARDKQQKKNIGSINKSTSANKNKQQKLKQSNIQDFKTTKTSQIKNTSNKKIILDDSQAKFHKNQQKKIVQQSQSSQSSDSSYKQQQKSKLNSKNRQVRKIQKSSSTNSQDSQTDSSKLNESSQKKNQDTKVGIKQIKSVDKNTKKIQINQSQILKKNKPKQKKPKDSDDQSQYAPSQREASKNKKQKKIIKQKQNSSNLQKKVASKPDSVPLKGILKNEMPNQKDEKSRNKPKLEILEQKAIKQVKINNDVSKNIEYSQQRSLRKKKPVSYKHMEGDVSDQEIGQKVPYRSRFKSNDILTEPLKQQTKAQFNSKQLKLNQIPEKMDIEEQKNNLNKTMPNDKKIQPKSRQTAKLKEKNINNNIEDTNTKKQTNIQDNQLHYSHKANLMRPNSQFQMRDRKNNLCLQSRVIVQSVLLRVNPLNCMLLAQIPSQQMQQKIKLMYQLLEHAPCCPLWKQGNIRRKKIIEPDQHQPEQQLENREDDYIPSNDKSIQLKSPVPPEEHQNHQQIADFSVKKKIGGLKKSKETQMEEAKFSTNKQNKQIQNQSKLEKDQKIVSKSQDQEQILIKKSSRRLRQKKQK